MSTCVLCIAFETPWPTTVLGTDKVPINIGYMNVDVGSIDLGFTM